MGCMACTKPQCLYKGALYLYLWSWKSRATPLLPLWAVWSVQSLSACTRVHFTFTFGHERVELYLYSPMGCMACTEPQCLYKGALYLYLWAWKSRAIPLLPLWAVWPVQSLSACTRVHFTFTVGHERVELYLYYPYGLYALYRASVPVQGWPLPLPQRSGYIWKQRFCSPIPKSCKLESENIWPGNKVIVVLARSRNCGLTYIHNLSVCMHGSARKPQTDFY